MKRGPPDPLQGLFHRMRVFTKAFGDLPKALRDALLSKEIDATQCDLLREYLEVAPDLPTLLVDESLAKYPEATRDEKCPAMERATQNICDIAKRTPGWETVTPLRFQALHCVGPGRKITVANISPRAARHWRR